MKATKSNQFVHYAVLLAGGLSSRMGNDKALLKRGPETLLDYGIRQLELSRAANVLVSRNEPGYLNDRFPAFGPMSGIHAALMELPDLDLQFLTILPVDMPLITHKQITLLQMTAEQKRCPVCFDTSVLPAVIPVTQEIKQYCQSVVEGKLSAAFWRFMKNFNGITIKCDDRGLLVNTNTPIEWQEFEQTYRGHYGT